MLHAMKSPIIYYSSKKVDLNFLEKECDEPSIHRLCCSYSFNLLKGSLLPLPLKLGGTLIWLPHMSHHHPQTPLSSSSAEMLQE